MRWVMSSVSDTTRRSAVSRNNVKGVMVTTIAEASSVTTTTTSGRIAITAVIVATITNAKRNRRTWLLLIAATRHSSHALRTSTPPRSATRIPRTRTSVKPMKKTSIRGAPQQCALHKHDNELHASINTPVPSEDPASASSKTKTHEDENYHLHVNKKLKTGSHVPCKSDHRQHRGKSQLSQKG